MAEPHASNTIKGIEGELNLSMIGASWEIGGLNLGSASNQHLGRLERQLMGVYFELSNVSKWPIVIFPHVRSGRQ